MKLLALITVVLLFASACGDSSSTTVFGEGTSSTAAPATTAAPTTTSAPATTATTDTTAAPTTTAAPATSAALTTTTTPGPWIISPDGVGPVLLGMTRGALVGLAVPWAVTDFHQIDVHGVVCEYFEGEGLGIRVTRRPSGVDGVLVEGIIDAIWAFPGSTAQTAEGVVSGETEAGVLATYGTRAYPVPNPYSLLPDYMIDATGWGDTSNWYAFLIEGGTSWAVLVSSDGYPPGGCA